MNNVKKNNQEKIFYVCLLMGCFFMYFLWANVIPFDAGPDEHMRYQIPEFIYKYGYLPHGGDERIRDDIWGISYGFTPILSYIVSAFFMKVTSFFTTSSKALILSARLMSVFFSTGTVYFSINIGKKLFNGAFKYTFVVSVALLPQFVFISSYVNNDAFGIFTVAWVVYAMILANEKKWNFNSCAFLGVGIGFCALSYYNCYGIILIAIIYAVFSVINNKDIDKKIMFIFIRILWVGGGAFVIAGWWFIRNAIIYDGDFLGMRTSNEYAEKYALEPFKPSNRATPHNIGLPLKEMLIGRKWIESSVKSFIGMFDALTVPLEQWSYNLIYIVTVIGIIGSLIPKKVTGNNNKMVSVVLILCCYLMCGITIFLSLYYSYFSDFQPQGRYCLPMLITLNILLNYGWDSLTYRCKYFVRNFIAFLIVIVYCVIIAYAIYNIVIPVYIR
ncbi:MAG: glycosyltransferase family 39 protein [Lachnospiraceae bacterium]|nr:glycosyltransferase family 39 protein [Lachnospiraceae bacterium]